MIRGNLCEHSRCQMNPPGAKSTALSSSCSTSNQTFYPLSHVQNFYEKPAFDYPLNQMSVWLMLGNEGMDRESNSSFCAPTPSAMVFGRSDGDRVAVTRDLALRTGYTLQFKVAPPRHHGEDTLQPLL